MMATVSALKRMPDSIAALTASESWKGTCRSESQRIRAGPRMTTGFHGLVQALGRLALISLVMQYLVQDSFHLL